MDMRRWWRRWKGTEKMKKQNNRLQMWQMRFEKAKSDYQKELNRMDWWEKLYDGTKEIAPVRGGVKTKKALHVRNIVAEMIESQVSSTIPMPKVTAVRAKDEHLAKKIENWLRNEINRLPFEELNDQDERTTYIQGGDHFFVEWDTTKRTHTTEGAIEVNLQHPKTVIPEPGVLTGIEDMDYIFVAAPRNKRWIQRTYGKNVDEERESDPGLRSVDSDSDSEEMVTQIYAYWRNDEGGIGLFTWVDGTHIVLEDLKDYQARQTHICTKCGAPGDGCRCSYCGSTSFTTDAGAGNREMDGHQITEDIERSDGSIIPAWSPARDEDGALRTEPEIDQGSGYMQMRPQMEPTVLPYYKPNVYPIVLRKNVSQFGKYLGGSDVEKIEDQQESIKKLGTKALEKVLKGGSIVTMPKGLEIKSTDEELKLAELKNPAEAQCIGVYNVEVDNGADLSMENLFYEEGRSTLGITDSFQGKRDSTATSGKAKQFAAQQSAGRLESKRVMKDAAYQRLFELMFKYALAYMDEPREIVYTDGRGGKAHDIFNPYDFLQQDAAGEWFWNDQFLFSVDSSASLVQNREALWQETRLNYQQGCYGPVGQSESLFVFWRNMSRHHYPGADDLEEYFRERLEQEQMAMQMQAPGGGIAAPGNLDEISSRAAAEIAQRDAAAQSAQLFINGGGRDALS